MGLDVYTYRIPNKADLDERVKAYEAETNDEVSWKKFFGDRQYQDVAENELEVWRQHNRDIGKIYGLDEWGSPLEADQTELDQPHPDYPDHLFRIGYFRSSYNAGGINHKLEESIGKSLYDVCGVEYGEYDIKPDWEKMRDGANTAVAELEAWVAKNGNKMTMKLAPNPFSPASKHGPEKAMEIFQEQANRESSWGDGWSNLDGEFYPKDGIKVYGFVYGADSYGKPCTYAIIDGYWQSYIDSLKIVAATADYVLKQPDPQNYYQTWSG